MRKTLNIAAAVFLFAAAFAGGGAVAQSARPSTRDALGCSDRDLQNRIANIANSGDHEAFKKIASAGILSGKCRVVSKGTMLFIADTAFMSGLACFRPAGDIACLWMSSDLTR